MSRSELSIRAIVLAAVLAAAAPLLTCVRPAMDGYRKIDPEVMRILRESGSARVMIALARPHDAPDADPSQRGDAIADLQRSVLDALEDHHFTGPDRFTAVPALVLTILSEDALIVLDRHASVESVGLDPAGRGG